MRTWRERLRVIVLFDWLSGDTLHLFLELGVDLVDVLGPDQHARLFVSCLLESSLGALCHRGCQDVHRRSRELRDVLRHSHQHPGCSQVIFHLHESFGQLERVDKHQFVVEVVRYLQAVSFDVLVCVEQHIMRVLVVACLLLLLGDVYSKFNGLLHVSNRSVQLESPGWLFWDVVHFAHQVINELSCEWIHFDLAHHLDHLGNSSFSVLYKQFKGL